MNCTNLSRYRWRVLALSMSLLTARGACGYDFPLSESAIRDAYFLGTKGPSQGSIFLGEYTHAVNQLKVAACTSAISRGVDQRTPEGEAIRAVAAGTITFAKQFN